MGTEERTEVPDLIRRLASEARTISFFQLVHQALRAGEGGATPGGDGPAEDELFRFRPAAHLGFAASDIRSFEVIREESDGVRPTRTRYRLTVNFMGLYGPASPMPTHLTEEIIWAGEDGQQVRDFLDIFHHRLISFVYRAWERVRHPRIYDPERSDAATRRALCLIGLGTEGMLPALGKSPLPLLRATGLLHSQHRSAAGLEALLRDHFGGIPVRVDSCVERRVRLRPEQTFLLGRQGGKLGEDACIGEEVKDLAGSFRIAVGPLDDAGFRAFLPGGRDLERLSGLVRYFVSGLLDFEVELLLNGTAAPACRLSPDLGLPLGQMTWLLPKGDRDESVIVSTQGSDPLFRRAAA